MHWQLVLGQWLGRMNSASLIQAALGISAAAPAQETCAFQITISKGRQKKRVKRAIQALPSAKVLPFMGGG